jgi:hypothetical protein
MRTIRTALFLMVVSALGCAGFQPVRLQLPPGARIGILNVLEPHMTHVNVGSLRFNSFTNSYDVDWDIPGYIQRTIENDLRARGHNTFIPLAADALEDWKQSMSAGIISAVSGWFPRGLRAFLERAAEENRLEVIVSVSSFNTASWPQDDCFNIGKSEAATKGYGLFTRTSALSGLSNRLPVGQNTAAPFANIIVAVFQTQPVALAAYGRSPCSNVSLPDFPWASDLRFLSPAVIHQVRPYAERLGAEAAQTGLRNAGLLP